MKKILNYSILLLLLVVFVGCGGPTINMDSDERQHVKWSENDSIMNYKGIPFSGTLVKYK